jgi:HD superfamily phosphohydrolase
VEVRDPVHGSIAIFDAEIPILEHAFFQRLRRIKQLGFSEYVFPGATHTRYIHSIGVMNVSTMVFNNLFQGQDSADLRRLKETLRLGCLLHDIGHAPLSHSTESVMPNVSALKLPSRFAINEDRQASHEDYTIKSIVDSSFTESFKQVRHQFGIEPEAVAELVTGETTDNGYFTVNGVNYFPLLHQLVTEWTIFFVIVISVV